MFPLKTLSITDLSISDVIRLLCAVTQMFDFNNHILQSFGYEEIIGMSGKDGLVRLVVIKG